jgi:hypothetical protein
MRTAWVVRLQRPDFDGNNYYYFIERTDDDNNNMYKQRLVWKVQ